MTGLLTSVELPGDLLLVGFEQELRKSFGQVVSLVLSVEAHLVRFDCPLRVDLLLRLYVWLCACRKYVKNMESRDICLAGSRGTD